MAATKRRTSSAASNTPESCDKQASVSQFHLLTAHKRYRGARKQKHETRNNSGADDVTNLKAALKSTARSHPNVIQDTDVR